MADQSIVNSIGRELRIKESMEEIAALRNPLFVEPVGAIPVKSSSLEKPHNAAEQSATTQPTEESQRSVLLFMLEDPVVACRKNEHSHQEWMCRAFWGRICLGKITCRNSWNDS